MDPIQVEGTAQQLLDATKSGDLRMYADWVQGALFKKNPKPDDLFFLTIIDMPNRFSFVLVRK